MAKKYNTRIRRPVTRDPVPVTHVEPRLCRVCKSSDVTACDGSHLNSSGVRVQYGECRRCGARNVFIFDRQR